jgi:hypothetical protein
MDARHRRRLSITAVRGPATKSPRFLEFLEVVLEPGSVSSRVVGHGEGAHQKRRQGLLALVVLGSAAFVHCGFNRNEVECEEAVQYLSGCCPGFDPGSVNCTQEGECDGARAPDLLAARSECILGLSCEAIKTAGLCDDLTTTVADPSLDEADGGHARPEDTCR